MTEAALPIEAPPPHRPLPEFVAMVAWLLATLAFSLDAMLPALPAIAAELTPDAPNRATLIVMTFMIGMGLGTLFAGPSSDAWGRRPVIFAGIGLYMVGALLCWVAPTMELLIAGRVIQGMGAAAPRIVTLALTRDLFEGRRMAQITSFVMTVFMLVPAMAPSVGAGIIALFGWRDIFGAFIIFSAIGVIWFGLRQPETLPPGRRRPLRLGTLVAGARETLGNRMVVICAIGMTLGTVEMMSIIASTQPIYDVTYGKAASFPAWFAASALVGAFGTIANGRLVTRLGMKRLVVSAFGTQVAVSLIFLTICLSGPAPFAAWFAWSAAVFFTIGMTFGNLTAMALRPLGHIAGLATTIITATATIFGAALAIPVTQLFAGTPVPLVSAVLICAAIAFVLTSRLPRDDGQVELRSA